MKTFQTFLLQFGYSIFMAIVLLFAAFAEQWFAVGVSFAGIISGLIPVTLEKVFKTDFSVIMKSAYAIFLFASQFLGSILNFYGTGWWDTFLHFVSGVFLALLGYDLFSRLDEKLRIAIPVRFLFIYVFVFAMAGAALWELYEFSSDVLLNTTMQGGGNRDTMLDILAGTVGGLVTSTIVVRRHYNGNKGQNFSN